MSYDPLLNGYCVPVPIVLPAQPIAPSLPQVAYGHWHKSAAPEAQPWSFTMDANWVRNVLHWEGGRF